MSGRALAVAVALGLISAGLAWLAVWLLSPWALLAWPALYLAFLVVWLAERRRHPDAPDLDPEGTS